MIGTSLSNALNNVYTTITVNPLIADKQYFLTEAGASGIGGQINGTNARPGKLQSALEYNTQTPDLTREEDATSDRVLAGSLNNRTQMAPSDPVYVNETSPQYRPDTSKPLKKIDVEPKQDEIVLSDKATAAVSEDNTIKKTNKFPPDTLKIVGDGESTTETTTATTTTSATTNTTQSGNIVYTSTASTTTTAPTTGATVDVSA
jgi:hypothetical protein